MKKIFIDVDNPLFKKEIIEIVCSLYPEKSEFVQEMIEDEVNILIISAEKMMEDPSIYKVAGAIVIAVSRMQAHLVKVEADYKLQDYQITRFDEEAEEIFNLLLQ